MNICAGVRDIAHPRNVGRVRAAIHRNNWLDNNIKHNSFIKGKTLFIGL